MDSPWTTVSQNASVDLNQRRPKQYATLGASWLENEDANQTSNIKQTCMALESRLRECLQLSRADADRITDLSARLARSEEAAKRALASRGPPSASKLAARALRAEAEAADATRAFHALQLSLERGRCRSKMLAAENASLKVQVAALRTARRREVAKSGGTERRSKAPILETTSHAPRHHARTDTRHGSGFWKQPAQGGPARAAKQCFLEPDPGHGQLVPVPWVMWRWREGPAASVSGFLLDPALGVLFRRTAKGDWPVPVGSLCPLNGRCSDERSCHFGPLVEEALRLLARGMSSELPFAPPVFRSLCRLATPALRSRPPAGEGRGRSCALYLEELADSAAEEYQDRYDHATRPLREALEHELREEAVHIAGAWSGLADWLSQRLEASRAALCLLLVVAWHMAACVGSVERNSGLVPELAARALSLGSLSVYA